MNYVLITKRCLQGFIGFLGLTAVIAIVSVLSGDFGELHVKILATSFTISTASICSMACAAFINKKKSSSLGFSGILFSVLAAILIILLMWLEIESEGYLKITITVAVGATAFAHAFLLALPDLGSRRAWIQKAASISIGVLACQIIAAVWGEIDHEGYYRVLAVVAIIVVLETLVVPLFMKLQNSKKPKNVTLVLEQTGTDRYRDSTGAEYRIQKLEPGQEEKSILRSTGDA